MFVLDIVFKQMKINCGIFRFWKII
jgi:hypothetical protein